jgi:periplasmic divalent cation tolerance protein
MLRSRAIEETSMSARSGEFVMVLTTASSETEANAIARRLVEDRLAACVNVSAPIRSVYRWKGEIAVDDERMLWIKTTSAGFEAVARAIRAQHSYENPEIVRLPIDGGSEAYLRWIRENVADGPTG